jgi:hypothetical protein
MFCACRMLVSRHVSKALGNRFLGDGPLRAEDSFSGAHQLHSTPRGVVAR